MKTFLILNLASTSSAEPRFLIGGWPVTGAGGLFARAKRASSQRAPMPCCKHMIFRRLGQFCTFFGPFLSHKGADFPPVTAKPGNKRFRGQKMKCGVNINRSLIGNSGGHEPGVSEMFHGSARQIQNAK
jgi:hypothetical protein